MTAAFIFPGPVDGTPPRRPQTFAAGSQLAPQRGDPQLLGQRHGAVNGLGPLLRLGGTDRQHTATAHQDHPDDRLPFDRIVREPVHAVHQDSHRAVILDRIEDASQSGATGGLADVTELGQDLQSLCLGKRAELRPLPGDRPRTGGMQVQDCSVALRGHLFQLWLKVVWESLMLRYRWTVLRLTPKAAAISPSRSP